MDLKKFCTPETRMGFLWGGLIDRINKGAALFRWSNAERNRALYVCPKDVMFESEGEWDLINGVNRDWVVERMEAWGDHDGAVALRNFVIPVFPITGYDLIEAGYKGKELGKRMDFLKIIWFESDYKMDKMELMEYHKEAK